MSEVSTDQQVDDSAEQSEQDQAVAADSGVAEGAEDNVEAEEEVADDDESESEDEDTLLSQADIDQLKGKPEELAKKLNQAWTKKTQLLATERKQLEPYLGLIEQLNGDEVQQKRAVAALAAHLGMNLGEGTKAERQEQAKELGEILMEDVRAALGPEYGDLADRLAPAMQKVAERVASEVAKPLAAEQHRLLTDVAARESAAAVQVFEKTHPDFKKHEAAMVALSKKLQPNGMSEQEYLSTLYAVVTASGKQGDAVKKAIKRINDSTKSGSDGPRVPAREVKVTPTGTPSFAEAAEAAERGEVWAQR
jgi:hypothetical protein